MYILTVYFLYKSFLDGISRGGVLLYLAALSPLTGEGLYWLSASSRLVVGMFFASGAFLCLKKYFETKKWAYLVASFALCLVSMGFYEQITVAAFAVMSLMIWTRRKTDNVFKAAWAPILSVVLIGAYYVIAGRIFGQDSRVGAGLNLSAVGVLSGVFQIAYIFTAEFWQYVTGVFKLGLLNTNAFVVVSAVFLSAALGALQLCERERKAEGARYAALLGMTMAASSLLLHFMTQPVWICLRNVFIPVLGIGVALAAFADKIKVNKYIRVFVVFVTAFVFCVSGAGDTYIYKTVHEYDSALSASISENIEEYRNGGVAKVYLICGSTFYENMPSFYKDHVKSAVCSDWELTGSLISYCGDLSLAYTSYVSPVRDGDVVETADNVRFLYEENGTAKPLEAHGEALVSENGETLYTVENNIIKKTDL